MNESQVLDRQLLVLHVLGPLRRSGAEMMLLSASHQFSSAGVRSVVASLGAASDSTAEDIFLKAGLRTAHLGSGSRLVVLFRIWRLLGQLRPDVVHVHAEAMSLGTSVLPRIRRIGVVRTIHSIFAFEGRLRLRRSLERRFACRLGVVFVAVSQSVFDNESVRFGTKIRLIRNWFDDRRFQPPSTGQRGSQRRALGVSGRPVIAVVGNCSPVKRHGLVLEAMALLPESKRPFLIHVGDASGDPSEALLARRLAVEHLVRLVGPTDDVARYLHASDAFVMSSRYEGLGIAALEAAATGLPLLLADAPGLRDLVCLGPHVSLFPPRPRELANLLADLVKLPSCSQKRDRCIREVRQKYSLTVGVNLYLAAYDSVVFKGG